MKNKFKITEAIKIPRYGATMEDNTKRAKSLADRIEDTLNIFKNTGFDVTYEEVHQQPRLHIINEGVKIYIPVSYGETYLGVDDGGSTTSNKTKTRSQMKYNTELDTKKYTKKLTEIFTSLVDDAMEIHNISELNRKLREEVRNPEINNRIIKFRAISTDKIEVEYGEIVDATFGKRYSSIIVFHVTDNYDIHNVIYRDVVNTVQASFKTPVDIVMKSIEKAKIIKEETDVVYEKISIVVLKLLKKHKIFG